jgi:hypothetical protein
MPKGRHSSVVIQLTPEERMVLRSLVQVGPRARIVLLRAAGRTITDIARAIPMSRHHVYTWLRQYQTDGIAGLYHRWRAEEGRHE